MPVEETNISNSWTSGNPFGGASFGSGTPFGGDTVGGGGDSFPKSKETNENKDNDEEKKNDSNDVSTSDKKLDADEGTESLPPMPETENDNDDW